MTISRAIRLRWYASPFRTNIDNAIRIRVEVVESENMPMKIFAYQAQPMRPSTGDNVWMFDHVCSAVDLADYPEDAPIQGLVPAWFRKSFVDVLLRSTYEAQEFLDTVLADVRMLKDTLLRTDQLYPTGTLWIDSEPTGPALESLQSSAGC